MSDPEEVIIGIDLGTTYCCVAAYYNNKLIIIENDMGHRLTPSYVTIKGPFIYVGDVSKDLAHEDPQRTIFDVKRLIGRNFHDPQIQSDIFLWPFPVVQGPPPSRVPKIQVDSKTYFPEEISAKLLRYLKKTAEEKLGIPITKAVVTVPAYFNGGQRQATKDAGKISGLEILKIINEPTAAAIAYNLHETNCTVEEGKSRHCLIFDLGGGTFDVAILRMKGRRIEIKAVDGHSHLGGEDFDYSMVRHCITQFKILHSIDLNEKKKSDNLDQLERNKVLKALRRLKVECQKQKEFLSSVNKVLVSLDVLFSGKDLTVSFDRILFNKLNERKFQLCIEIIGKVLKSAGMTKEQIDDVVLVGGSSRIVKIQEMLSDYFGSKKLRREIDFDEAVARGAAIQAVQLNELSIEKSGGNIKIGEERKIVVNDVIHLPIGLQMERKGKDRRNFSVIIEKNTGIPCSVKNEYTTVRDGQEEIEIYVYQGEGKTTEENIFLGHFKLTNIPKCPEGEPVEVTMEVDAEGILHVSAMMTRHPVVNQIVIVESKGRLSEEQIDRLSKIDIDMKINPDDVDFEEVGTEFD